MIWNIRDREVDKLVDTIYSLEALRKWLCVRGADV